MMGGGRRGVLGEGGGRRGVSGEWRCAIEKGGIGGKQQQQQRQQQPFSML